MIENYLRTQITVYEATSVSASGDVTYGDGTSLMAKIQVHPALSVGLDGVTDVTSITAYFKHQCVSKVLIEYNGVKHPSKSVTNFFKFGNYEYTRVDAE